MKYLNQLFLFLIVLALGSIAFFLFKLTANNNSGSSSGVSQETNTNSSNPLNSNEEVSMNESTAPLQKSQSATVSGKLCYPSEVIPSLDIYLSEKNTDKYLTLTTQQNTGQFKFENVPAGNYIAFAYTLNDNGLGGVYSKAVPCGLSVNCTDHTPIVINVQAGVSVTDVDICDWYSQENVPPKPEN